MTDIRLEPENLMPYEPLRQQLARRIATAVVEAVPGEDLGAVAYALPTDREVLVEIIKTLGKIAQDEAAKNGAADE